jgi:hypothetical protein
MVGNEKSSQPLTLQTLGQGIHNFGMVNGAWLLFCLLGLAVVGIGLYSLFSRQARTERRRRKSHGRVISKGDRKMVRLSVRSPKEK